MKTALVIPARYASKRLPGKPLVKIAGKSMLSRVYHIAELGTKDFKQIEILVATDDERIADHCKELNMNYVMTDPECPSGTDRAFAAVNQLSEKPDFIINLQGDAPLTPPWFIRAMIEAFYKNPSIAMVTPCVRLTWKELDQLRENKKTTPFSGTTVVMDKNQKALWFSKNILPAMRKEKALREKDLVFSPVYRHIGLYGHSYKALETFFKLDEGYYEALEGLEQLRFLENHFDIQMVIVDYKDRTGMSGVDSPVDVERAEAIIAKDGEF
ncbi:MAG: 3-deoxy-manno-octulosonate cytidylyltransferase [Gammaproteobacteria bacterium]|nr:3-deoxy-manno-octulosonate cytidylyltransferase [Gammaproteobacteria bacterium]